uniref:Ciliosis and planar polarity effector complex subunit 1 n=1 Tax=Crocodylus porosus TaxID=8502 RepID=A0A7M4FC75_CROPO
MEIKLDVLISTCIKQRRPWPRISWLGQEKEAIFLLDAKHINEINLVSGKTKKKIPRLQTLLKNVAVLTTSQNGAWLAGILTTGELFLWNKDQDCLKTVPAIEESTKVCSSMRLYLYVSGDGKKVLLTTSTVCIFLWESTESKNVSSSKNPSLAGCWSQILPKESVVLPSIEDKETGVNVDFIKNEILGDCCLCSFVFYSVECLMLTFLVLRCHLKFCHCIKNCFIWAQQKCSLLSLVPQCEPVKLRGALLTAFARDGLLLAVAMNQNDPKATRILFLNTLNLITVSGNLKGCSSKNHVAPSKFIRSYWVADMSWTHNSLFLVCMLKRGSFLLLTRMGELLTSVTSGCSIEFGPAEFIPLHPLITYRSQQFMSQKSTQSLGSSASENDLMRQRFSVTAHPRLPYLIFSDGYMVTVLRFVDNLSPSGFIRSLLLDSAQKLERVHQGLMISKSKGKRLQLQSLSSLKSNLLKQHQNQKSALSTIPKFLQEETVEWVEKTAELQDHEEESDEDEHFQNSSSAFWSPDSLFDQGQLEFASMFDTTHAEDDTKEKDDWSVELNSIQKNLLAAWETGISKNVQEKDVLLNYTISCITYFFSIIQYIKSPSLNHKPFLNKSADDNLWIHCVLKHFQQFLSILFWGVGDEQTIRYVVKLTSQTIKVMLVQQKDQLFSKNLLGSFCLLKMVTRTLNGICTPEYEVISTTSVNSNVKLDSLIVPIFQVLNENVTQKFHSQTSLLKRPPYVSSLDEKPENRLTVLWRLLYKHVLWYQAQLNRKMYRNGKPLTEVKIPHEESVVASLLSHIQATLQSSGVTLEQNLKLNSVIGEEQFLLGSYKESLDIWKRALQEVKAKGGIRAHFLQTRYFLAILYCHLYCYNLREAQGLCDHLVGEILRRSQLCMRQMEDFSDFKYSQHELWMIQDVHTEAAMAVIQSMARFMAAYFTNQILYVLPSHNVGVLPPLHIKPDKLPRVVPLQHSLVTKAVRDQNLSSVWTAEYALELLFVGGLIPEAVWLTHKLGDWKMAVSISIAYNLYCKASDNFSRSEKTELHLPLNMSPTQTFQEKLQSFLGQPVNFETLSGGSAKYKQFTDPIEEEDANVLFSSVQEILKAAVMADADILSETFQLLMDSAKDLSKKMCGLVPHGLYLPAPPLYCPQPASLSEEDCNDPLLKMERHYRQKMSGVLQRILLLFGAACCSYPAAQWYIVQLKRARKIMQKIRIKGSLTSLSPFPETLLHYSKYRSVFFKPTSSGDHQFDEISCKTIGCFRELCALCWMLHVREKLSDSCRRYQTARESIDNQEKTEYDACIVEHCLSAVEWAYRMLPFSRFMNVEELVQDIILSLVGELPPIRKVAEVLVKAFPNPENIRVPLRDKYYALQQRLRHCIVRGPKNEEMMSVVIEVTHKVRLKALKRVIRNIGPPEMSIWEPSEEETPDDEAHCYDRLSLGTSLSRSTLTDFGYPLVHSDAETADTLSEVLLIEKARDQVPSLERDTETRKGGKDDKIKDLNIKTKHKEKVHSNVFRNQYNVPVVGVWEFERDDEEYINFLELFLSYMLERDLINCPDPGIPFLTSFSGLLREHELNSLLFDVHTTLKRRMEKTTSQNVFRTGCCYTVVPASCDSKPTSVCNKKQKHLERQMSFSVLQPTEPSLYDSVNGINKYTGKKGLFGLSYPSVYRVQDDKQELTVPPVTQTLSDHACSFLHTPATCKYVYEIIHQDIIPREELALDLKNKFSNIARLLEWMIRWSDKRLLCDSNRIESFQESYPMMHVKTSAAAILTSLWLLEQPYYDGLRTRTSSFKVRNRMEIHFEKKKMNDMSNSLLHTIEERAIDSDENLKELGPFIEDEVDVTSENEGLPNLICGINVILILFIFQLQQINFMSLMQIVGSSFANLPNMQHLLQQSQFVQLGGSQLSHAAGDVEKSLPTHSSDGFPETQLSGQENTGKSNKKSSAHSQQINVINDQDRNVSLIPSEIQSHGTGFTPASQGLLPSAPAKPLHLLSPAADIQKPHKLIPVSKTLNYASGFPLLRLESDYHFKPLNLCPVGISQAFAMPPLQPKVAWGPPDSLQNLQPLQTLGNKSESTTAHLNVDKYNLEFIRQAHEEKKRWAEALSKGPPKHLHVNQYEGQQYVAPEQYLSKNMNAEKPLIAQHVSFCGTSQCPSGIPLLHLQLDPVLKFPPVIRQLTDTSLITVRTTTKETDSRDAIYHPGIAILHNNLPPKYKVIDFSNIFSVVQLNKQKRRAENQIKEEKEKKKTSVTFRPEDSIIGSNDIEVAVKTETQFYTIILFYTILDTFRGAVTTSAALHFMASTRKKPAEVQDASTNTDPEQLLSSVPQMLTPDVYLNLRFPPAAEEKPDATPDLVSDLPVILESTEMIDTTQQLKNLEVPSSAKLHHLAASVTNTVPPNKHLQHVSLQIPEENIKSDSFRDSLTWNLMHEDVSTIPSPGLTAKLISKEYLSTKLQEMDIQLLALQNIAENMEKDFGNTKLVSLDHLSAPLFEMILFFLSFFLQMVLIDYKITFFLNISSVDDPLQTTGLSGMTDIIKDLVTEGDVSATELGFTEAQARQISRIHGPAVGCSQKTEKEKKVLQAWMKRKQKERLAEYLNKRDEQREKEHMPFNKFGLTSKEIKLNQKKKEEKDKALLSEHHNFRVSQALSLMNEMLSETVQLPTEKCRPLSRTARSPRASAVKQGRPGLHAAAVQTEETGLDNDIERESLSPWSIPDDIQRILRDHSGSFFEGSVPYDDDCPPLSTDDIDNISESTGSILSKLDWNAVEAMVANVEDK